MRPKKDVGMKDVAAAVGVSVVTVSNAFSGKGGVSEEIRTKILEKAAELGYVYAPKKSSQPGNGPTIVYWYRMDPADPYELSLEKAIPDPYEPCLERAVRAAGYRLRKISGERERVIPEVESNGGRGLEEALHGAAGVVAAGDWPEEILNELLKTWDGPTVSIENFTAHAAIDFIVSDRYHAAFERAKGLYRVLGNSAFRRSSSGEKLALILAGSEKIPDMTAESVFEESGIGNQREQMAAETGTAMRQSESIKRQPDRQEGHLAMSEGAGRLSGFIAASFYYHFHESGRTPDSFWSILDLGNDAVFTDPGKFLEWLGRHSPADYPQAVLCISEQDAEKLKKMCRDKNVFIPEGIWNCGTPDYDAMAEAAAAVLVDRIQGKTAGRGVHFVPEIL